MGVLTVRRRTVLAAPLLGLAAAARAAFAQKAEPPPPLLVIVARGSALETLSLVDLRALFLGDPITGPDRSKLIPINQPPGSPDRVAFDRLVLGMTPEQSGRYWIDRRIRGEGRPPRTCEPDLLPRLVARFPGTVSYLRGRGVDPALKVVRIDGRSPTDRRYPLVG